MIRRLSETWKQQKRDQLSNSKRKCYLGSRLVSVKAKVHGEFEDAKSSLEIDNEDSLSMYADVLEPSPQPSESSLRKTGKVKKASSKYKSIGGRRKHVKETSFVSDFQHT